MTSNRSGIFLHAAKFNQGKGLFIPSNSLLNKDWRACVKQTKKNQNNQDWEAENQPQKRKSDIKKTYHKNKPYLDCGSKQRCSPSCTEIGGSQPRRSRALDISTCNDPSKR